MDRINQFRGLWRQESVPDLWQFLDAAGPLDLGDVVLLLAIDRDERWRRGDRIPAETYLERRPDLAADSERAVDLIYSEFLLRKSLGEPVEPEEFLRRFPQHAETLRGQIAFGAELDRILETRADWTPDDPPTRPAGPGPPSPGAPAAPGYEVLERLGSGGMGVVYKARQIGLDRIVALKMLKYAELASTEERDRFRTEAEAIARSPHPNIVQVFEIGEHQGQPFFSMEFCPGGGLDKKLNGKPLPPREGAALTETLARAVHAAHQQKVVHRDLKPANVLLTAEGTPKVSDFGLAKKLDAVGQTASGSVLGTVNYMAPEQAAGKSKDIGPAADVYALGAILFECLTGRPPFQAPTDTETLLLVLGEAPPRPRLLQPKTPHDLETICLKCLEKDPRRRYGTACELAEDLRRFLDGRPILARRTPAWEHAWRWCRRYPLVAGLWTAVVAAVLIGFGFSWYFAWSASWEAGQKTVALNTANTNLHEARLGETQLAWEEGRIDDMRDLLEELRPGPGEEDQRGFEWYYWDRLCHRDRRGLDLRHRYEVGAVAFVDGQTLASATTQGDRPVELKTWDLGEAPVQSPAVTLHAGGVVAEAFSPDRRLLAVAGWRVDASGQDIGQVALWRCSDGVNTASLPWGNTLAYAVAFSADGGRLAVGGADGQVGIWDLPVADGAPPAQQLPKGQAVTALAFGPRGRLAVIRAGGLRLWDTTGSEPRPAPNGCEPGSFTCLAFADSPVGPILAAGGKDGVIQQWDALSGGDRKPLTEPAITGAVAALAFSRDGSALAAGYQDHTVRRWDVSTGALTETLVGHSGPVAAVAFSPDGALLATGGRDKAVKLWDLPANSPPDCISPAHDGLVLRVAWAPDGKTFASAGSDGCVYVWDGQTSRKAPPHPSPLPDQEVHALAFSADGRWLATGGTDKTVRLWDVRHGVEAKSHSFPDAVHGVLSVAFSPDGTMLAVGDEDGVVHLCGVPDLEEWDRARRAKQVYQVAFSRKGVLAAASGDGTVGLWKAAGGALHFASAWETGAVYSVAFSPDGDLLAAAADDHEVKLWDMTTMKALDSLRGHTGRVWDVAFSPDGRTLASASADKTIKLWSMKPRPQLVATLRGHAGKVLTAAFRPPTGTGDRSPALVSGDWSGTIRVWRASPGEN